MPTFVSPSNYATAWKTPGGRSVGLGVSISVDMGNLPTLPERMDDHLREALIFHLRDTCEAIIELAKLQLFKPGDFPEHKHGVDTGRLRESLTYHLVEILLDEGVYYDLMSDDAPYWKWVEFGHWVTNSKTPHFWPGYHYLESTIKEFGLPLLMRDCRAAWHDTAMALAAEARMSSPFMGSFGPNVIPGHTPIG